MAPTMIRKNTSSTSLPSRMPMNPLYLVSFNEITSFVPARTLELEFISSIAASMATFAALPTVELKVNMDPMWTKAGRLAVTFPAEINPKQKTRDATNRTSFISAIKVKRKEKQNEPQQHKVGIFGFLIIWTKIRTSSYFTQRDKLSKNGSGQ